MSKESENSCMAFMHRINDYMHSAHDFVVDKLENIFEAYGRFVAK